MNYKLDICLYMSLLAWNFYCDNKNPVLLNSMNDSKEIRNGYETYQNRRYLNDEKLLYVTYDETVERILLYRCRLDGSGKLLLNPENLEPIDPYNEIPGQGYISDPRWGPDGKRIVFTSTIAPGDYKLVIMNENGTNKRFLFKQGSNPEWNPKGVRLLFHYRILGAALPAIIDTLGNWQFLNYPYEYLTFNGKNISSPDFSTWTPDGSYIYLSGILDTEREIFTYDYNTAEVISKITNNITGLEGNFIISPDGNKLICAKGGWPSWELYHMNLSDTVLTQITTEHSIRYRWSNDSKFIVYLKQEGGGEINTCKIYIIDPEQPFNEQKLFDFGVIESAPDLFFEGINTGIWDDY